MKRQLLHLLVLAMFLAVPLEMFAESIPINAEKFPDPNFRQYVQENIDTNGNGYLSEEEITNVTEISVYYDVFEEDGRIETYGYNVSDMTGIEYFTELVTFFCGGIHLTTPLNLSGRTALTGVFIDGGTINSLNLSGCTALTGVGLWASVQSLNLSGCSALTELEFSWNVLSSLNVSGCTSLTRLECNNNNLESLKITGCTALSYLACNNNKFNEEAMDAIIAGLPETTNGQLFALGDSHEQNVVTLSHIAAAKEKGWTSYLFIVEGQSEEEGEDYGHWEEYVVPSSTDITVDKHSFPDDNFRSWVLEQDYGKDGVLTEEEIAAITHISVCGKNISDLTGIEHFTALTYLACFGNQLASLDVSNNTALTELDCEVNQLTSLDVSNNTALTGLICFENQLTSLDVSNNTALTLLHCGWNPLTSLDVSNNIALTELYCHNNQLTSLDVSNNTALAWLWCFNNQIKGAAMDALIAGLPDKGGGLYAIDDQSNFYNEQNVVTKAQVTAAKEKGWITYYYDSKNDDWLEYEGDETDGIEYNNREATATIYYNLNGQRVSEPIKGVFIRGGKKVLVK